jgi:hypothetical protein
MSGEDQTRPANWLKARPTEFRGVRYDSKGEAVFARALELAGNQWEYHPETPGEHNWDFRVKPSGCWELFVKSGQHGEVLPFPETLVEYKPGPPTDTYIEELTNGMRPHPEESVIVWGSPWNGPPDGYDCCYQVFPVFCSLDSKYGWGNFDRWADNGHELPISYRHRIDTIFGITEAIAQEAKLFRFDLRS